MTTPLREQRAKGREGQKGGGVGDGKEAVGWLEEELSRILGVADAGVLGALHDVAATLDDHVESSSDDEPPLPPPCSPPGKGAPEDGAFATASSGSGLTDEERLEGQRRCCLSDWQNKERGAVVCDRLKCRLSDSWVVATSEGQELLKIRQCFDGKTLHGTCKRHGCKLLLQSEGRFEHCEAVLVRWGVVGSCVTRGEHGDEAKKLRELWRPKP